ncbi:MAG TPA: DUF4438 domain-containing protein [Streptosporangiaceae bacterium]|nr:DUF4438 domain-containing protein [Streptosporangiaceae bacterium]
MTPAGSGASGFQAGDLRLVTVSLLGAVEHPALDGSPYRIDRDGRPYVPAGDGGIVLGLELGDSVFALDADHAAPGACLVHADPAARHALAAYACVGNEVRVRTGAAAGARGVVLGKRGEEGRVIAGFAATDLARIRPGDEVSVRARGQGWRPPGLPPEVAVMNLDPGLLPVLPIGLPSTGTGAVGVSVRVTVPSRLAGNGIGRPATAWDLDLQLPPPGSDGAGDVLLGDLVAVSDLDVRHNMGYRRGWVTVGITVHGASPLPGHGPGITPLLTGPAAALRADADAAGHVGLTAAALRLQ